MAFRPTITVDELGKVEDIQATDHLEDVDLFTQFVIDPGLFRIL
jgi:hypothetical protein